MSGVVFAIAVAVWLLAAYAFVRIAMAWLAVARLAPQGRGLDAALSLGTFNFPQVMEIAGAGAAPAIGSFRDGVRLFLICLIPFFGLILLNALSGNAA